jgi:environmental stress-induced protein Ves
MEGFDWRVSVADIETSGPFSRYPYVDRCFVLLDGGGLTLHVDGAEHRISPLSPFDFDGGSDTACVLSEGSARALNVMTRRGRTQAAVDFVPIDSAAQLSGDAEVDCLLLALSEGLALTATGGAGPVTLGRLDGVHTQGTWEISVVGSGDLVRIDISG